MLPIFAIFGAFLSIATGIFANKMLLANINPNILVGLRMSIAGSILILINIKFIKKSFNHIKKHLGLILIITLSTTFFPSLFKAFGLQKLHVSHAALLGGINPLVTALYAYLFFKEKLNSKQIIGICLGLFASIVIPNWGEWNIQTTKAMIIPQIAFISGIFMNKLGWILVSKALREGKFQVSQINGLIMVLSGILAFAITPILPVGNLAPIESYSTFYFWLSTTIIIGNLIGYNLYVYAIKKYNITMISLAGCSIPLLTSILNWVFTGQTINYATLLAITLLFVSLLIFNYDKINQFYKTSRHTS